MLALGGAVRMVRSLCVGGWTLTARFRCLIRPNPLVRPVPPQPARENGNTLSLEVSLVPLPLPPAIGGQRASQWSMLPNFAGKGPPLDLLCVRVLWMRVWPL